MFYRFTLLNKMTYDTRYICSFLMINFHTH